MKKGMLLWMTVLLMLCAACASAEVLYASPGGMSLTEALAKAKDGDVIELDEGVYAEPDEAFPLTVTASITIRAKDGVRPVVDAPAFQPAFRVEADGVTFCALTVRMRRTGFYVTGSQFTLSGCDISLADPAWRTSSCGVWLGGVIGAKLTDCRFTDCGVCMAGPPLSETSHTVPVLTGLFEVGEETEYFTTHIIERCTVNGKQLFYAVGEDVAVAPAQAGEIIIADCKKAVVANADVSRCSMGMEIVYCQDVRVTGCRADDCGVFGIYLAKNAGGTVRDSSCTGTNHGIDIRACENISVVDCRTQACDQGIFFSGVKNGLVKDCTVRQTGQGYFFAAGSHSQIDGCTAIECENGFNIQKEDDMLITGCTLTGSTICAVRLDGSPTIFAGNTLTDNWVGVMAYGGVPFVLTDNAITNSGSCGLYLRDIGQSRICANSITASVRSSVEALGELSDTRVTGNRWDKAPKWPVDAAILEEGNSVQVN